MPSYKDEEKALAIAWFVHVGADLHNPIHNGSRVTDTDKEGDQGGNLFIVRQKAEGVYGLTLHGYWDDIVSDVNPRKNDACDIDYLAPLGKKMIKKYSFAKMSARLNLGNYKEWNDGGFAFLQPDVYTPDLIRGQMPSKKYQKRAYEISREQITLAGYRIGETMNRVFGNQAK